MELFLLYLWLKVDAFIGFSTVLALGSAVAFAFTLTMAFHTYDWEASYESACKFKKNGWKKWIVLPIVSAMFALLMPSKTDIAVLVGGSYALDIAKSPEAAKLMTVIRGKANEILDEQINKLGEKK